MLFRPIPNQSSTILTPLTQFIHTVVLPEPKTIHIPRRARRHRVTTPLISLQYMRVFIHLLLIDLINAACREVHCPSTFTWSSNVKLTRLVLRLVLEQRQDILHAKLADCLAAHDDGVSELALRLLQLKDTFFDAVVNGEAIYDNVDRLIEAVETVDGLFFDKLDIR
jgi:hypothetical protein